MQKLQTEGEWRHSHPHQTILARYILKKEGDYKMNTANQLGEDTKEYLNNFYGIPDNIDLWYGTCRTNRQH